MTTKQPNNKTLKIPNKAKTNPSNAVSTVDYGTDMRTIENWANNQPGGGYASLTGPGETTSPGALTQIGDFIVLSTTETSGLEVTDAGGVQLIDDGTVGIGISELSSGPISIVADGGGPILITGLGAGNITITINTGNLIFQSLPTSDPGVSGAVWNNGGVLNVSP